MLNGRAIIPGFFITWAVVVLASGIGWIMNLIRLIELAHMDHPNLVMVALRVVSLASFFPAAVMGWIPN